MIGVILANTGSPSSPDPDDIERYLSEFLMDERIRQLPKPVWKWLVTRKILPKRKYSSAERYRFIWQPDGSPLLAQSRALAGKVQGLFDADHAFGDTNESDVVIVVRSAMSYGSPSIAEVLADFRNAGVDRVVLLPLYPQSAYSPTMAVVDSFWRAQDQIGWHPDSTVIDNYHDDEGYIAAIVRSIRNVGFDASAGDRLLLSLHAIPLKDEAAGDTYREQIAESVELIADGLGIDPDTITVAYQSVSGAMVISAWCSHAQVSRSTASRRFTMCRMRWFPRLKAKRPNPLSTMLVPTSKLPATPRDVSCGCPVSTRLTSMLS